jgi:hypothetical protein
VLLEGPAIEPLLAQVRDEYGSRARIISADKVRSGGVGGFFAKQHYELSVEVPDPTEDRNDMARQTTVAAENGHTLERLLERAEAQDRVDEPVRTVTRPIRPAAETEFGADEGRRAALSDTGAAFAELMAGLDAGGHQSAPATVSRPSPTPRPKAPAANGGQETPTVRPFRPATATTAPINAPSSPAAAPTSPAAVSRPAAAPTSPAAPSRPAVAPTSPAPAATGKPLPPLPNLAERIGGLSPSKVEVDAPIEIEETAPVHAAASSFGMNQATTVSPTSVVPSPVPAAPTADNEPVVRNLMSVGMPEAMARKITGGDTYAGVLSVLAARPSAPGIPDGPGEILVLAGDVNLGVPIARQLLDQIGVGENHLLLAAPSTAGTGLHSSRLISTPEAAESRAEKLHSAEQSWVVVIDAPVGGTDPLWVNEMCDAIGATAVWAVVDATRKTADTARHLRTLGEVEALVVHSVELTGDPASVLGLDLPIYSLDGKPATPHAWAAMLCARIASDVMPVAAVPRRTTRAVRQ